VSDAGDRTGHAIKRAEQALIAAKDAALRPFGLTVPQYAALLLLHAQPGLSGAELARRALVTPQTMSTVLGNLERKGLVERAAHPVHSRIVETRLTAGGGRLLRDADRAALAVEAVLDAALGPEVGRLRDLLTAAAETLEHHRARSAPDRAGSRPPAATR
jgi:DNA-binding MarR family transcriptional regulator